MSSAKNPKAPRPTPSSRPDIIAAMKKTTIISSSRTVLPAEIIAAILDFLPIADMFHFARTSRRMREMVYDDTRWVARLRAIGVWNEGEARARQEDVAKRRLEAQQRKRQTGGPAAGPGAMSSSSPVPEAGGASEGSTTLFDAAETSQQRVPVSPTKLSGGFANTVTLPAGSVTSPTDQPGGRDDAYKNPSFALNALSSSVSIRGGALREFARIYGALGPYYFDTVQARTHADPAIFRLFREPEQQASMLRQLAQFAKGADWAQGWHDREEKLRNMSALFETAALREFEGGMGQGDAEGRMRRYASVLVQLNGGAGAVETFVKGHPIFNTGGSHRWGPAAVAPAMLKSPLECLMGKEYVAEPASEFFHGLAEAVSRQADVINRVFPDSLDALTPFLERLSEDIISDFVNTLLDVAHARSIETYLKAFAGIYGQAVRFARSVRPTKGSTKLKFEEHVSGIVVTRIFEPHVDLYLQEELDFFRGKCDAEMDTWEKRLRDEDLSAESFFMSNVTRQQAKRDFLTSFKKVVMMPVAVMPFTTSKAPSAIAPNGDSLTPHISRSGTPDPASIRRTPSPGAAAGTAPPTTELAAKAALMNSRLEGIRSLFSIEVALTLVHGAKASLDRATLLARQQGGRSGTDAKEQCEAVFVQLLQTLGSRHIKAGFDRAIGHLSDYKPRDYHAKQKDPSKDAEAALAAADGSQDDNDEPGTAASRAKREAAVVPLTTFLELVNVGDLIQQMVDVFYAQELVGAGLVDRDDFVSPAVKEKRRFEQMLDERVAAGLNKGIDVLMDELEYVLGSSQAPADFNPDDVSAATGKPAKADAAASAAIDIGPSLAARRVVEIVSTHTSMLVGSTDKTVLDVFNQEIGVRLFTLLCKHLKRQRVSIAGSIKLISDMNAYYTYIAALKNKELSVYFTALRELAQIFMIGEGDAKEIAVVIADGDRYRGIFRAEEVYEFAERRADWFVVRGRVEKQMYGIGCGVM